MLGIMMEIIFLPQSTEVQDLPAKHNPSLHTAISQILTEQDLPSTVFVSISNT